MISICTLTDCLHVAWVFPLIKRANEMDIDLYTDRPPYRCFYRLREWVLPQIKRVNGDEIPAH